MLLSTWENVGPHRDICVCVCACVHVSYKIQSGNCYVVKIWRSVCDSNKMLLVWFLVTGLGEKPKGK